MSGNRYGFAVAFIRTAPNAVCSVDKLRLFNVFALLFTMIYACDCRSLISLLRSPAKARKNLKEEIVSADTLHTAMNIALFPPLFFFSGLFYTDVISTAVVLRTYKLFLGRRGVAENNGRGLVWVYVSGVVALTMRQTNIFWVAVFMGGLEAVRTVKANASSTTEPAPKTLQEQVVSALKQWTRGQIHDIPLNQAGIHGKSSVLSLLQLLTPPDFILTALSLALAIISKPLLILPRLWPYIALLLTFASFVLWNGGVVLGDKSNHVATIHLPQMLYIWPFIAFFSAPLILPSALSLVQTTLSSRPSKPVWKYVLNGMYAIGALVVTLGIIRYNTIIHPFTLADNRHYIFYVFRYSILRHPLIRYLLAPIYLICAYLVFLTLAGPPASASKKAKKQTRAKSETVLEEGPTTSFVLILLLTTALSLVTAPLVEPRYFIIPWGIWRLHVPSGKRKGYDWRLWVETAWFLGVIALTGWVFLYRGFEWRQEPGAVQRFMW